jgi:hypothetical protein
MVKRTFFKVGNGLFAVEQNDACQMVYDCGGENQSLIIAAVNRANIQGIISLLFISHYDNDHVNGLKYLLTNYKVKYVFLPMLEPLVTVIAMSRLVPGSNSYIFISDPVGYVHHLSPDTQVKFVEPTETEYNDSISIELDGLDKVPEVLHNNTIIHANIWKFILFNRRVLTRQEQTQYLQNLHLPSTASVGDIIQSLLVNNGKRNTLKFALRGIFTRQELANLNDYSMVVWSGSTKSANFRDGCLYTGDYNAKKYLPDLHTVYKSVLNNTAVIVIPHHGSVNNFDAQLPIKGCEHVISAANPPYINRNRVNPRRVTNWLCSNGYSCKTTLFNDVTI